MLPIFAEYVIWCADMKPGETTEAGKEYLPLPAGAANNYAERYKSQLRKVFGCALVFRRFG
jgi:hypothetical protein